MKIDVSFDSFDLIMCVALWGGFATGNWLPLLVLVFLGVAAAHQKS